MSTTNEIIEAAGLDPSEYPGARLAFAINKIIQDHEVLDIAERLAREAFIVPALRIMDAGQLARLRKRIQPEPIPTVRWVVSRVLHSGRPQIIARWRNEEIIFDGRPENAPLIEFHGEHPSAEILAQYSAAYDPTNVPQLDPAFWKARWSKDTRRLSGDE